MTFFDLERSSSLADTKPIPHFEKGIYALNLSLLKRIFSTFQVIFQNPNRSSRVRYRTLSVSWESRYIPFEKGMYELDRSLGRDLPRIGKLIYYGRFAAFY